MLLWTHAAALVVSLAVGHTRGSGTIKEETRHLTSAEASGGASLTADATPGPKFVASASGGSKVSVKGVDSKQMFARVSGGGTISISNLKADSADIEGSGGATISLSGSVKRIETKLSGGAGLKAQDVPAEALRVSASGGSRVYAQVSSELSARLSGGATVHLKGNPGKREIDTSGGSKIYYEWGGVACWVGSDRASRPFSPATSDSGLSGSRTVNVAPSPGLLCTAIVPPSEVNISRTIHSPSPKPP